MDTTTDKLRQLRREIARIAHPDMARTDQDRTRFTVIMSRANAAFSDGSTIHLEAILAELTGNGATSGPGKRNDNEADSAHYTHFSWTSYNRAQTITREQARQQASITVDRCRAALPRTESSNIFLQAIMDFIENAMHTEDYTQIDRLGSSIEDILVRWDRIKAGDGKKMAEAFTRVCDILLSLGWMEARPPFHYLYNEAVAAFVALSLPSLNEIEEKTNLAQREYHEHMERIEVTLNIFLQFPADQDTVPKFRELLAKRPYINYISAQGSTLLHAAVEAGCHREIVRMLVQAGADINARNQVRETPLHIALKNGDVNAALTLLDLGADASIPNAAGNTNMQIFEIIQGMVNMLGRKLRDKADPSNWRARA